MNPKVSIIVPCYNQGEYLEEAVQSILNSSFNNYEVLIIDDGSTDNSQNIGNALADQSEKIKFLAQENKGPAAARNYGIRECKGEYILPLDADDRISPDYLSEASKYLDDNPEAKVVYCEAEYFGNKTGEWKLPKFDRHLLARKNMIFISAMYRKSDWEKINGYSEEMTWGWEDWEFWIAMLKDGGDVIKLPITGFYYRVKEESRRISAKHEGKLKTINFLNKKHFDFIQRELNGPLRKHRSWSKVINMLSR